MAYDLTQQNARPVFQIDPATGIAYGASGAPAGAPQVDAPFAPLGHQTVTVTSTATALAALLSGGAMPVGTKVVYLQPRGDGIRYAHGGSTPTTASDVTGIGTDIFQGGQYPIRLSDFSSLKLVAASNTLLSVEFRG